MGYCYVVILLGYLHLGKLHLRHPSHIHIIIFKANPNPDRLHPPINPALFPQWFPYSNLQLLKFWYIILDIRFIDKHSKIEYAFFIKIYLLFELVECVVSGYLFVY